MVEARGGRVIWTGRPEHVLIGDTSADAWDLVALVSYPSRAAFIDMVTSPSTRRPTPTARAGWTAPSSWPASPCSTRSRVRGADGAADA